MNNMITQNNNLNNFGDNGSNGGGMPQTPGLMPESLFQMIWRSRWFMLISVITTITLGFIYVIKVTPIFTSTSRVYVEQSGPKIISEEEGLMTQSKNYLYTQAELLKSTPILASALEAPGIKNSQTFRGIDNPVAFMKRQLNVSVGKKDDIISVSFNSPYPSEAAQIVNTVVESYITYNATMKKSTSSEVLKILRNEKDKRGQELSEKLKAMMDFKMENEAISLEGSKGNIVIERLNRLSEVLTEAQLETIEYKSFYESTQDMMKDPVQLRKYIEAQKSSGIYISTGGQEDIIEAKIDALEIQIKNLLKQISSNHPMMVELQEELEHAQKQKEEFENQFAQAQLAVAEQQYIMAKEKEEQIAEYYDQQRLDALSLNQQLAQYTILESEWEQTKKLCDILDERIKELNVTEDVGALNISILEIARPADAPSEPQKARVMAIALMLGLMAGSGIALLRGWMDQKLHSADEISAVLGLPVLGIIPSMSKKLDVSERGLKVHKDSQSTIAESYRTIRTAVFFGAPKGETRTILVTSPTPSDGKTTMSSNLAIAMAQSGQKTLLIDADFRKPMQHKIFKLNHEEMGLSSVLAGMVSSSQAIKRTEVVGLDLLTCGPEVPNPSEMLNSESFAKLIEYLCEVYDRIIIDSPPVMPVTDAQIIAALCDITLLVLRADKSTRKASQQARDGLLSVGARLLGTVVNDVNKRGRYGYSGYGQYYSYYGYGDKKRKTRETSSIKPAAIDNVQA